MGRRRRPSYDPELDRLQVRFRLPRLREGTRIFLCEDRSGRWGRGYYSGTVVHSIGSRAWILWDAEEPWEQDFDRDRLAYLRDRGLLRIKAPEKQNVPRKRRGILDYPAMSD